MKGRSSEWNPCSPRDWADLLGLVYVPLLPQSRDGDWEGEAAALLDGLPSSFAAYTTTTRGAEWESEILSWAWSAHLRHSLVLNTATSEAFLRRWDSREQALRAVFPEHPADVHQLFAALGAGPAPTQPDVVSHLLRAFRQLRTSLPVGSLEVVRVFNALLLGAEAVHRGSLPKDEWLRARTLTQALQHLDPAALRLAGVTDPSDDRFKVELGAVLEFFVMPEPNTGCVLDPDLLLRHASGHLYQEAHIVLEREPQRPLAGIGPDREPHGALQRGVRFTPTSLARLLVEQAFRCAPELLREPRLEVLDPACGSGVFLQEALRELQRRRFSGKVVLRGFDASPIATAVALFCLQRAEDDARRNGVNVTLDIREANALAQSWGAPQLVLMNPPFESWHNMEPADQSLVRSALASTGRMRPDKAMAFVWNAVHCLAPGGILATVLPAALLETDSGHPWREELASLADLDLLGRFQGYGYFKASTVEASFLVLRRRLGPARPAEFTRVLLAEEGFEDTAIRAMRRYDPAQGEVRQPGIELYTVDSRAILPASWLPRPARYRKLIRELRRTQATTVGTLFEVHRGIQTGNNSVFVLDEKHVKGLPRREQKFFRPAATSAIIRNGVIHPGRYVFYPYDADGPTIRCEAGLKQRVPHYYRDYLASARENLVERVGMSESTWWLLQRPRLEWQTSPKLVSKYFGEQGSFAYDKSGEFAVVQGYAWIWRGADEESSAPFANSCLPYAYLALLNSPVFEDILASFCPRVLGGQMNLSNRFVEPVFIPDLSDESRVPSDLVSELAALGRAIANGNMPKESILASAANRAYGLPRLERENG